MISNRTLPHCSYDLDVRTVALVGRLAPDTSPEPLLHVIRIIADMGKQVVIEARTHDFFKLNDYPRVDLAEIGNVADVLISVGGDGTMLGVAREVAPQSLSNRPIVLPHTCKIQIEITSNREAAIHCDTQVYSYVRKGDQLNIQLAPHQSIFWHPLSYNYFATLRQKLHWQLNPSRPL